MKTILCLITALIATMTVAIADVPIRPVTDEFIPVALLAGATPAAVTDELGKPTSCDANKYGQLCFYKNEAVEVMFIDGMADWFTIYPANAFMLSSSLTQIGLPATEDPTFETAEVMRWKGLQGLLDVTAFAGASGRVSYFYVKARTP